MTAHPSKPIAHDIDTLEPGAQADASAADGWIGIAGLPGSPREACARALGLDAEAATALLRSLQARNETPGVRGDDQTGAASLLLQIEVGTDHTQTGPTAMSAMTRAVDEASCLPTLLAQHPRLKILGFYLSPWEAFLEACEEGGVQSAGEIEAWMQAWSECHQKLVAARQAAPDRVFLINAGRIEQPEGLKCLLQRMGVALSDRLPEGGFIPKLHLNAALSRLLASKMAETGREYWEIYESLESCAVLFERQPEFRGTIDLVEGSALTSLLLSFCQAQMSAVEPDRAWSSRDESGRHCGASRPNTLNMLDDVQRENELLSLQLNQLYDELQYYVAYSAALRGILTQAGETAEAARRMISELARAGTDAPSE